MGLSGRCGRISFLYRDENGEQVTIPRFCTGWLTENGIVTAVTTSHPCGKSKSKYLSSVQYVGKSLFTCLLGKLNLRLMLKITWKSSSWITVGHGTSQSWDCSVIESTQKGKCTPSVARRTWATSRKINLVFSLFVVREPWEGVCQQRGIEKRRFWQGVSKHL